MKRETGVAVEAIEYTVRRSRRRRRTMAITVDTEGTVQVAVPIHVSSAAVAAFVQARSLWIEKQRKARRARPVPKRFGDGESSFFLGREYALRIHAGTNRHTEVRLESRALAVSVPQWHDAPEARAAAVVSALAAWYRLAAERVIGNRILHYQQRVGVQPKALRISNAKGQWGSCGPGGTIRISWRLVMAPLSLIDYVIVHELCHLRHSNHGRPFWRLVGSILPDYESLRSQLRRDGDRYAI